MVSSWGVRGALGSVNLLNNVIKLGKLLSLFICLAKTYTHLLGGVHAKSIHNISEEEHVKLALAIPIVDVTDLFHSIGINHLVCFGGNTLVITRLQTRWLMPML